MCCVSTHYHHNDVAIMGDDAQTPPRRKRGAEVSLGRRYAMAGTLERGVKYDQEAFTKAWDYLANDEEEAWGQGSCLFDLSRKCLGFSVVTSSILFLVWNPQVSWV